MNSYTNLLEIVFHLSDDALVSLKAIIDCELRYREIEDSKNKPNIELDKDE